WRERLPSPTLAAPGWASAARRRRERRGLRTGVGSGAGSLPARRAGIAGEGFQRARRGLRRRAAGRVLGGARFRAAVLARQLARHGGSLRTHHLSEQLIDRDR